MLRLVATWVAFLIGCRGAPPGDPTRQEGLSRIVDSLRPAVERATGLAFKGPTPSAYRDRTQLREFLVEKLNEDFPAEREEGIAAVYRLLGLIPDTLDLRALLLDLYTEQVAGFYDPATRTLYGLRGADPTQLRLVLAHELVHAIQDQYLPLDSLMRQKQSGDRQSAVQAVLEGHATLASIKVLTPGRDVVAQPEFWQLFRDQIRTQQSSMQVFARTPLALRFELVFPYLYGAEFMRWWDSARAGHPLPRLAELPQSTEQILHPARYAGNDRPVGLSLADSTAELLYQDTMGELGVQTVAAVLRGDPEVRTEPPAGWAGDRFRAYRTPAGPALVWFIAWDDSPAGDRFEREVGSALLARQRPGYRSTVERVREGAAPPATRIVIAPTAWSGWRRLPGLRLNAP
jgi:hypothetical protein